MIQPAGDKYELIRSKFKLAEFMLPVLLLLIILAWLLLLPKQVVNGAVESKELGAIAPSSIQVEDKLRTDDSISSNNLDTASINHRSYEQKTTTTSFQVNSTRLLGRVTSLITNQPIQAVTVIVTDSITHSYSTTTSASGWYTFTDTITNPLAAGAVTIAASKAGWRPTTITTTIEANIDNRRDIQLGTTDLVVVKRDGLSTVIPGQTITYTITVTNVGSIIASNILITDVLPTTLST